MLKYYPCRTRIRNAYSIVRGRLRKSLCVSTDFKSLRQRELAGPGGMPCLRRSSSMSFPYNTDPVNLKVSSFFTDEPSKMSEGPLVLIPPDELAVGEPAATDNHKIIKRRSLLKEIDNQTDHAVKEIIEMLRVKGKHKTIEEFVHSLGRPIFLPAQAEHKPEPTLSAEKSKEEEVYFIDDDASAWKDFVSEVKELQHSREKRNLKRRWKVRRGIHMSLRLLQAVDRMEWQRMDRELDEEVDDDDGEYDDFEEGKDRSTLTESSDDEPLVSANGVEVEPPEEIQEDNHVLEEFTADVVNRALQFASMTKLEINTEFYNVLLARLSVALDLSADECLELIFAIREQMKKTNVPHDSVTYDILMWTVSQRLGSPHSAIQFVKELMKETSNRSSHSVRAAMQLCKDIRNVDLAIELWDSCIANDQNSFRLSLDIVATYVEILKFKYLQDRAIDALRLVLDQNRAQVYRAMDLLCESLINWPLRNRSGDEDNTNLLQSILDILLEENRYEPAQSVWKRLIEAASKNPDDDERRPRIVYAALKALIERSVYFFSDKELTKIAFDTCEQVNDTSLAVDILSRRLASVLEMAKSNKEEHHAAIPVFATSADIHSKIDNQEHVQMETDAPHILLRVPSEEAIRVLNICRESSDLDAVQSVLTLVEEFRHAFHPSLYRQLSSSAIKSFAANGKTERAAKCLERLIALGESPSESNFGTLMHGHVEEGNFDAAADLYDSLEAGDFDGVRPGPTCYNSLILGCLYRREWADALAWYEKMLNSNVKPLASTYAGLLLSAYKIGGDEQALSLLSEILATKARVSGTTAQVALKILMPDLEADETHDAIRKHIRTMIDNGDQDREPLLALLGSIRVAQLEDEKYENDPSSVTIDESRWLNVLSKLKGFTESKIGRVGTTGAAQQTPTRMFSTFTRAFTTGRGETGQEWRKHQLRKLEEKFETPAVPAPSQAVESEDDLQQMWREMEGRVTRRRPRMAEELGGKTGRTNIKQTDEELWQREGLYDGVSSSDDGSKEE